MIIIVLGIAIIIVMALLVYKYEKIEAAIFGNVETNFSSIGGDTIKLSIVCGGLVGAVGFIYQGIFDRSAFSLGFSSIWGCVVNGLPYIAFIFISYCVYKVLMSEASIGGKIGRSLFIIVASLIGMIGGAILSILAIAVIVFFIVMSLFSKVAFSGSGATTSVGPKDDYDATTTDENGYERKLKKTGACTYRDDKGDYWEDDGLGFVKRKE